MLSLTSFFLDNERQKKMISNKQKNEKKEGGDDSLVSLTNPISSQCLICILFLGGAGEGGLVVGVTQILSFM